MDYKSMFAAYCSSVWVQRSSAWVQSSSVVSALFDSRPAPIPRPSRINYFPKRRSFYPAQEDIQQAKSNVSMKIVVMYVS